MSGITLLGVPTEVYQHGSAYFLIIITIILTCLAASYVFVPVFYKLQLASVYEYLEVRFCRKIRTLASLLYIVSLVMYIPLVVYAPALAFSQITGYSLYAIVPVLCCICIVYTSLVRLHLIMQFFEISITLYTVYAVILSYNMYVGRSQSSHMDGYDTACVYDGWASRGVLYWSQFSGRLLEGHHYCEGRKSY